VGDYVQNAIEIPNAKKALNTKQKMFVTNFEHKTYKFSRRKLAKAG
jgi:hypothetical protein